MPVPQVRLEESCSVTLPAMLVAFAAALLMSLSPVLFSSVSLCALPALWSPQQLLTAAPLAARLPLPASITVTASMPVVTSRQAST